MLLPEVILPLGGEKKKRLRWIPPISVRIIELDVGLPSEASRASPTKDHGFGRIEKNRRKIASHDWSGKVISCLFFCDVLGSRMKILGFRRFPESWHCCRCLRSRMMYQCVLYLHTKNGPVVLTQKYENGYDFFEQLGPHDSKACDTYFSHLHPSSRFMRRLISPRLLSRLPSNARCDAVLSAYSGNHPCQALTNSLPLTVAGIENAFESDEDVCGCGCELLSYSLHQCSSAHIKMRSWDILGSYAE
jgi:hypothetical protein